MIVQVKLFAIARQLVGSETVSVELNDKQTVADLRAALVEQYPSLEATMRLMMVAVNTDYASDATVIGPNAEVALIPPVSGG